MIQPAAILHLVVPPALAHCDHGAATTKRKVVQSPAPESIVHIDFSRR